MGRLYRLKPSTDATALEIEDLTSDDDEAVTDSNWSTLPANRWAIRVPRFLAALREGFVVADRSFLELPSLSVFESRSGTYARVTPALGAETMAAGIGGNGGTFSAFADVAGAFYFEGGLLISHPSAKKISWYGDKEPAFAQRLGLEVTK
jgi:hypothetical protein